jgi:hypothetical protein
MHTMNIFILIVIVAGIASLLVLNKPTPDSSHDLKNWFSNELNNIATNIEKDIDSDIKGVYPHEGKQTFSKRGIITYVLYDKSNARFDVTEKYALTSKDITQTEGYRNLIAKIRELSLSILLEEINVDGVDRFNEADEHTHDLPRYYTVTICGW